jgi:hypothetical protein
MVVAEASICLVLALGCAATAAFFHAACSGTRRCATPPEDALRGEPPAAQGTSGEMPFRSQLTSWEWLLIDAPPCCGRREETPSEDAGAAGAHYAVLRAESAATSAVAGSLS